MSDELAVTSVASDAFASMFAPTYALVVLLMTLTSMAAPTPAVEPTATV